MPMEKVKEWLMVHLLEMITTVITNVVVSEIGKYLGL
jgi:hypothetical protein